MTHDTLEKWERWPIAAIVSAQGLQVARWYAGGLLPPEANQVIPWLTVLAAFAAAAAIDGALIATVMAVRMGRSGRWSIATILVSAAFGGAVALDLHGAITGFGSWLHAGFALTIAVYLLHLTQPRRDTRTALATREQVVSLREQDLHTAEQLLNEREQAVSSREMAVMQLEQVKTIQVTEEIVRVATLELTWPAFEQAVKRLVSNGNTSRSSLRRAIEQAVTE
jgi:hypothetical protein